jgi:hypothetical protein
MLHGRRSGTLVAMKRLERLVAHVEGAVRFGLMTDLARGK